MYNGLYRSCALCTIMFYLSIFDSMEDTLELTKNTVLCFTWRTSEQVGRLQTKVDLLLQVEIVLQRRLVQTARPEGKVRGGAAKAFLRRSWGPLNRDMVSFLSSLNPLHSQKWCEQHLHGGGVPGGGAGIGAPLLPPVCHAAGGGVPHRPQLVVGGEAGGVEEVEWPGLPRPALLSRTGRVHWQ